MSWAIFGSIPTLRNNSRDICSSVKWPYFFTLMRVFFCNFDLADKVLLFSLYLSARNFLQYPFCTKLLAAPIIADFPLGVFRRSSIRFVSPKFEDCTATVHVCLFSNSGLSILFLTDCLFARFLSVFFHYRILFLRCHLTSANSLFVSVVLSFGLHLVSCGNCTFLRFHMVLFRNV